MILENAMPWSRLERWRAWMFTFAGIGYISSQSVSWYEINVLGAPDRYLFLGDHLLFIGFFGSMVGLLGLYPQVADRSPRATAAIAWFLLAGVAAAIIERGAVFLLSLATGTPYADTVTGVEPLFLVIYLSVLLGFLVFGVIGIHSRVPSRAVGILFLAPIATLILHIVLPRVPVLPDPIHVLFASYGVAMLGVGYLLWNGVSRRPASNSEAPSR